MQLLKAYNVIALFTCRFGFTEQNARRFLTII